MVVVNNPHNPTGNVFPPGQVEALLDLARRRSILILSDEIYDNFLYRNARFKSVLSSPDWRDYVVYVNGFSKTFSMTGWRLGYLVVGEEAARKIVDLAVTVYSCPPSIAQKAGVAALKGDWSPVREMIQEFEARAKILYENLREAPGIEAYMPEGAFYMFPRIARLLEKTGLNVELFVEKLLHEEGVLVLPGTSFPERVGKGHVRISFATSRSEVAEGSKLIAAYAEKLWKQPTT